VAVDDDKASDEACPLVSSVGNGDDYLDPGENLTCSASYSITQPDLQAGSVTNIASASAGGTTSPTDTATVTAMQQPALTIAKTADPLEYNQLGEVISYSYLVTNTGNLSLLGPLSVNDNKVSNETCPPVNSTGNLDGYLDPGENLTCSASYVIIQHDLDFGSVTNSASASAGGTISASDTATVTAIQQPALTIAKSADPLSYNQPGQLISYTYVVTNSGNVTLYGITVVDDQTNPTCPDTSQGLAPLSEITCTSSYTITQADLNAGSVTNTAYATDGVTQSDPDTATVSAIQNHALDLAKTADPLIYNQPGQVISYTYVVTNIGNLSLLGPVTVSDDKAENTTCPPLSSVGDADAYLDPGENLACSASYIITLGDLDAGSVTNLATASAGGTTSPSDSATVTAIQEPALTITKTADPQTYDHNGQVIFYSYLVTNDGNVTIQAPFNIFDDKTTNESCPPTPTSLSPGQSMTCSSSYTIQPADLSLGTVTNAAYARGMFNASAVLSNTDTEIIRAINIVKTTFLPGVYMSNPGVHVLPNTYAYASRNTQFIIGEISNNTNSTLTLVDMVVNFFNASDVKIGSSHSYLWPLNLPAWERGCFKISSDITSWSYYVINVPTYSTVATSPGLTMLNASGTYDPIYGDYAITGQVRNNGTQLSQNVGVSGTLYNLAGMPVGCEYNYVSGKDLNPAQTSSFTINFLGYFRNYFDVTSYKLRVSGELP
jgi:uncharacterized repeat protein (TIGR01451 family)